MEVIVNYNGVNLLVKGEYNPAEKGGREEGPDYDSYFYIEAVHVALRPDERKLFTESNIIALLEEDTLDAIDKLVCAKLES